MRAMKKLEEPSHKIIHITLGLVSGKHSHNTNVSIPAGYLGIESSKSLYYKKTFVNPTGYP